ncbi:MAG: protease complex subunit PrcB family protein [Deltaproteobacteria bacterium]|nr:protease complex subunit PrcB family protein [Deltaproteobacteria bacterium]
MLNTKTFFETRSLSWVASAIATFSLVSAGCAVDEEAFSEEIELSEEGLVEDEKSDHLIPSIPFTAFDADMSHVGDRETFKVFTSATAYRSFFGQPAPAVVNWRTDWVVYYSAGIKPTGGYSAQIEEITRVGRTLKVTTSLISPGPDCMVTQALTKPAVLAKFKRQSSISRTRRVKNDKVKPCGPKCAGKMGLTCPGIGRCIDDPTDTCDPERGGADCLGLCLCDAKAKCQAGERFDSSPEVCSCVKDQPTCNYDDHNKKYVSRSAEECTLIDFMCQEGTRQFTNECGCGCAQPEDCPPYINCMPGPGRTCSDSPARCPLSPVVR